MADINDVIAENLGLVYTQLRRFGLTDDQDAESLAYEALYKAIQTYDAGTGNNLSTYATCVVSNALRGHVRTKKKKRQIQQISYYTLLHEDEEDGYLLNMLHEAETAEEAIIRIELQSRLAAALDKVREEQTSDLRVEIFDIWRESNFTIHQKEIAKLVGVSQATVSIALGNFRYKLKQELEDYV